MKFFILFLLPLWLYSFTIRENIQLHNAACDINNSKYAEAIERLEALQIDHPYDEEINLNMGVAELATEKTSDALQSFDRVIEHAQKNGIREKALVNKGIGHIKLQEYKNALAVFEKVLELNSNNVQAQTNIEILKKLLEEQENNKQQNDQSKDNSDEKQQDKQDQKNNNQDSQSSGKMNDENQQGDESSDPKQNPEEQQNDNQGEHEGKQNQSAPTDDQSKDQRGSNAQSEQGDQKQQEKSATDHSSSSQTDTKGADQSTVPETKKPENPLSEHMNMILERMDEEDKLGNKFYLQEKVKGEMKGARGQHNW